MPLAPIFSSSEVREIEAAAQAASPVPTLMERAGLAAADRAEAVMAAIAGAPRAVLVVAGPGNNGGDAFEVAALLKRRFHRVDALFLGERAKLSRDAAAALARCESAGGALLGRFPEDAARRYRLIVDGLFGIGLARPLDGRYAAAVGHINGCGVPVLALDVPSGINADTGAVMGAAVRAAHTLTFIALKPGVLTLDGPDHCGELAVDALGLDVEALLEPAGRLLSCESVAAALAPRPRNFHKGNAGNVTILGGAAGMAGAALLAGRAALGCGAGRVYVGLLDGNAPGIDPLQPELMLRRAAEAPLDDAVIAAGPGLGQGGEARALLDRLLRCAAALVLDADALNLIAAHEELASLATSRGAPTLMTPHPAEAARLLGTRTAEVQSHRVEAALALASRYRAIVALKGNGTVVAATDGRWWINPSGHPGMASAGMGDALTGMVASLMAQGAAPAAALTAGVWLHGAAGDAAAKADGPLGTTASEVIRHARRILNARIYRRA
jgi:hydroxyethylthiazole kinase-like uncharacterized protein yjeF